jgi:hypothetical protein
MVLISQHNRQRCAHVRSRDASQLLDTIMKPNGVHRETLGELTTERYQLATKH